MPPKTAAKQPNKKQQQEKSKKVVEDKTFGLKNKKGAKAQKLIANIQKQTQNNQKTKENEAKKRREQKEKDLKELNEIFKPVISKQKIEVGTNPKSVLCVYFKAGQCGKGDKCKFSHDLGVEKKSAKKDLYTDSRDITETETEINNDEEDQILSEENIKKFHICNHFLKACEEDKYGWFWTCPNGGDNCRYKHALPKGYRLKKDMKIEEKKPEQTLEELLALDKAKFKEYDPSKMEGTPVTLERFNEWKAKFTKEKLKDKVVEKKTDKKLTGRELFTVNPDLEADGEDDGGISIYDMIDIKNHKEDAQAEAAAAETNGHNIEIDEDLFDENIDDLEAELNELEIE